MKSKKFCFCRGDKKFYACSTFRDRKDCDFYLEFGGKISQKKMSIIKQNCVKLKEQNNFHKSALKLKQFKESSETRISFCQHCNKVSEDKCLAEESHKSVLLTKDDLKSPVRILNPKSKNKKEAQYFFSEETTKFLSETVKRLKFTHVLCVGCPSIFEVLSSSVTSVLLDIDARFKNFYSQHQFIWSNVFNNHFFDGEVGAKTLENFLIGCENLLIIIDPPFGVKTELIHHALQRIKTQLGECHDRDPN